VGQKRKKKGATKPQVERAKRGAAAQAHSTRGRKTTFKDQTVYDRKKEKDANDTDTR
jgi:hypothetical protein